MSERVHNTPWRRSSFCSGGACVEVARVDDDVRVRDSKDPDSPELAFTSDQWREFINRVRAGDLDP